MSASLVGSEMCIRDRKRAVPTTRDTKLIKWLQQAARCSRPGRAAQYSSRRPRVTRARFVETGRDTELGW
eukprot:10906287-Alexandrium_andersonii.AAC.1